MNRDIRDSKKRLFGASIAFFPAPALRPELLFEELLDDRRIPGALGGLHAHADEELDDGLLPAFVFLNDGWVPSEDAIDDRGERSRVAHLHEALLFGDEAWIGRFGLKQDEDFKSVYLDHAGDGPAMVLDGRVAALWGAGVGWPGFTAIAKSPGGARFIAPDAEEIARIRAWHSFLKPMTVAAGSYPGLNAAINSLGSWSFILVRETLPDDVAYHLAKTLHGVETTFCQKLAQACETTAVNTVAAAPEQALIHPGVLRYLREIGLVK